MPSFPDRAARWTQAACLVAFPIALGAASALRIAVEGGTPTEEASIEAVAAGAGLWQVASYLGILASILLLPFALGLLRFAPARGRGAALVGTALLHVGAMGFAAYNSLNFTVLGAAARHADRGEAVRMLATIEDAPEGSLLLLLFLVGLVVGMAVLAVGLFRARTLPRWSPAGLGVFVVFFAADPGLPWVAAVAGGALLVGAAPAAVRLARDGTAAPMLGTASAPP